MRRTPMQAAALSVLSLMLPALGAPVIGQGSPASAAPPAAHAGAPAVATLRAAYGAGAVRLQPRQGVDVTFRARRGDRVLLDVRSARHDESQCFGTQTLRDGRGTRSSTIDEMGSARVATVRTTGRVRLGFRGYCAANRGQEAEAATAQLTKVRMREVGRDGSTSLRGARRGFLDIAFVTVRERGRDTLTLRGADGRIQPGPRDDDGRFLVGDRLRTAMYSSGVSVEAGHPPIQTESTWALGRRLRVGDRVGVVVPSGGYAESLRAVEHRVALDDPALTLAADPGREHVLVYAATPQDRSYVIPQGLRQVGSATDDPYWAEWSTYAGGGDRDDPSLRRTVVASDPDGRGPQSLGVRVRRTVVVADLAVGGAPVTFASAEPGTRFVAAIPASAAGSVRLTASDASTTGDWGTWVPPVVCHRDCYYPGLLVGPDTLAADGTLFAVEPHELQLAFEANTTGSVTLRLTDVP